MISIIRNYYIREGKRLFSLNTVSIDNIRNVAVVAHVDHGKTTLVDSLLKHCGCNLQNTRLLDQCDLEKEKGITILAKSTRLEYKGYILNIIDTPGHADFGGEVERVLSMVDGIILVVDLAEGPRPQSRFVLSKALTNPDISTLVVINKVDRNNERIEGDIENEIFDMFLNLNSTEEQMDYKILYGSAKNNWFEYTWLDSKNNINHSKGVEPLLDTIITHISCPKKKLDKLKKKNYTLLPSLEDKEGVSYRKSITDNFSMLVNLVEQSTSWGITITGAVASGSALKDSPVYIRSSENKELVRSRIKEILVTKGVQKYPYPIASAGDIVSLQLLNNTIPSVYDTIISNPDSPSLPYLPIDSPVIGVEVCPNTSPLQGKDGKLGSLYDLKTRLTKESLINLAIQIEDNSTGTGIKVRGRGNLQLGVLLETMRREGYEFEVTSPQVMYTISESGKRLEPWEQFTMTGANIYAASIMKEMCDRNAEMIKQELIGDETVMIFDCATRLFFGMSNWIHENTKGAVTFTSEFIEPRPVLTSTKTQRASAIIATDPGIVSSDELAKYQKDCRFFVNPNDTVYEGAVIGYTSRTQEISCNIAKPKKIQVCRQAHKDIKENLAPSIKTSIEYCIAFIQDDEILEVTPQRLCIRKKILSSAERARAQKQILKNIKF